MNVRSVAILALVLIANVAWDFVLLFGLLRLLGPGSAGMAYLSFPLFWLFPFIGYLVVLYRNGVFGCLQRVLRALVLCGVSFAATQIAIIVAGPLVSLVAYRGH